MIQKTLIVFALVLGPSALFAADNPAAHDLLGTAARQASLFNAPARSFLLDVDLTVQLSGPTHGHLRLRWEAKDRWWSKISMGRVEQVKFRKGDRTYTLRNADFTLTQFQDLLGLIHSADGYEEFLTRKEKQRVEDGVALNCVDADRPDAKAEHREICINSTTLDIVSDTLKFMNGNVRREQFSDFADFAGHRYPRRLELVKNGTEIISASVTELKESPLDPQLLVPPKGAIERRVCPDQKPPVVLREIEPRYTKGLTDVEVTILTDGTVGDVLPVGMAGWSQDNEVIAAIKRMKFQPAMCGNEPIVSDLYIHQATKSW